jgi:hypothetical protein
MRISRVLWPAMAVVALVAAACQGLLQEEDDGDRERLTVAQNVEAASGGVRIRIEAAEFSGTGTWLRIVADTSGHDGEEHRTESVSVPGEALMEGSIGLLRDALSIPVAREERGAGVVRLAPIAAGDAPELSFTAVDLTDAAGAVTRVGGEWRLVLAVPGDIEARLRVEELQPGPAAEHRGIRVTPVSAVRSRNETLVTIEIAGPEGVSPLERPSLARERRMFGRLLREEDDGRRLTFSFGVTEEEARLGVEMYSFRTLAPDSREVVLDMAGVMERESVRGRSGEVTPVGPSDHLASTSEGVRVIGIEFGRADPLGEVNLLGLRVTGAGPGTGLAWLQLPNGTSLPLRGSTSYAGNGPASTEEMTVYRFRFGSLEGLRGTVRLVIGDRPEPIDGEWLLEFEP